MEERKENKMGVMPVNKLLINMSLPIMISMLVQALYNIVDSIFVGMYNPDALTAVSLAFPVQSLMIAFSVGTGVGINSLLARRLGEKRFEEANASATNGLFLAAVTAVIFAVLGGIFSHTFMAAFTKNQTVVKMGTEYLMICTIFSIGLFLQVTAERLLQATGQTIYNMITQLSGAIVNIILDPILIFGLFGLPKMGIVGAAVATVIGQFVGMGLAIYLNHKKNHEISISFKGFKPNGKIIGDIYKVGFPSIIMQSVTSVMTVGMNKILGSDNAITVLGVYFKLQSFIFMPVFGLSSGMVPIVGYNFGARHKDRIVATIKMAVILSVSIMFVGMVVFLAVPKALLLMFGAADEVVKLGIPALRVLSLSFCLAGVGIILSSVFQAIGNGVLSLIMSLIRQLVVILPVAFILNILFGVNAVWYAFLIAEGVSLALGLILYKKVYTNVLSKL